MALPNYILLCLLRYGGIVYREFCQLSDMEIDRNCRVSFISSNPCSAYRGLHGHSIDHNHSPHLPPVLVSSIVNSVMDDLVITPIANRDLDLDGSIPTSDPIRTQQYRIVHCCRWSADLYKLLVSTDSRLAQQHSISMDDVAFVKNALFAIGWPWKVIHQGQPPRFEADNRQGTTRCDRDASVLFGRSIGLGGSLLRYIGFSILISELWADIFAFFLVLTAWPLMIDSTPDSIW